MLRFKEGFYLEYWYGSGPRWYDAFLFAKFRQYSGSRNDSWGKPFRTLISELSGRCSLEDFSAKFDQNTRNELRRAQKLAPSYRIISDYREFVAFYNEFARRRQLETVPEVTRYGSAIKVSAMAVDGGDVSMHAYLVDDVQHSRVRLLRSATCAERSDLSAKQIAWINKLHHARDMVHFAADGYAEYDFGGVFIEPANPKEEGINRFKASFGGVHAETLDYETPLYRIANIVRRGRNGLLRYKNR